MAAAVPSSVQQAVLVQSTEMPSDSIPVKGYDFNLGVDYPALLASYATVGYQATNFGLAVEEIKRMVCVCPRSLFMTVLRGNGGSVMFLLPKMRMMILSLSRWSLSFS
jgi:hypothetical protein